MGWAVAEPPPRSTDASLLGRDHDVESVARALETSRLVTLTGAPGIGKTRLAVAVSASEPRRSAVVELAAIEDPSLLPTALAAALALREAPGQSLLETIVGSLKHQRFLLVLDNCEHLRDACASTVARLLEGCPDLTVLATSREPLATNGEHVWPVPPLAVPDQDADIGPEAMSAYPAVALFVTRAIEVQPGFTVNPPVADAAADICRRLDGIPLAIELAAARAGAMTVPEIARRLEAHLGLLSDWGADASRRHATLTSALDWSYALLTPTEQAALCSLSAFTGTFEQEAATAVLGPPAGTTDDAAELLHRLAAKSLLVADADPDRLGRYRLLATVRTYAADKLEQTGTAAEVRTRHAHFYTNLAERAEPEFTGPRQLDWFDRIAAERGNLRTALEWSLARGENDWALRLAGALILFWRVRGPYSEGREQLRAALSTSGQEALELTAKALWGEGFLTLMAADATAAMPLLEGSLERYRELGDASGCARAALILADAGQHTGRDPMRLIDESVRLARAAGDHWCLAHALAVAGYRSVAGGDLDDARAKHLESIAVARAAGDLQGLRFGLIALGSTAVELGDWREAESLLGEAADVTGALGEDYDRAEALVGLGALAVRRGEYDRAEEFLSEALLLLPDPAPSGTRYQACLNLAMVARERGDRTWARSLLSQTPPSPPRHVSLPFQLGLLALDDRDLRQARHFFDEALAWARASGRERHIAECLQAKGLLARIEGDRQAAAAFLEEALNLQRQVGDMPRLSVTLDALAGIAARIGDHECAARLFAAAAGIREQGGYAYHPSPQYLDDLALVRRSLTGDAFALAQAEGRALSLDQAAAEVRAGLQPASPAIGWRNLSERERGIAGLVAEGLSNSEIAVRLVLARETVKAHLRRIYPKLGVKSRWELAAAIQAHGGYPASPSANQITSTGG